MILAGDGNHLNKMKELTIRLGLGTKIEFTGWIDQKRAQILLEEANAFVHHSITINGQTEGVPQRNY